VHRSLRRAGGRAAVGGSGRPVGGAVLGGVAPGAGGARRVARRSCAARGAAPEVRPVRLRPPMLVTVSRWRKAQLGVLVELPRGSEIPRFRGTSPPEARHPSSRARNHVVEERRESGATGSARRQERVRLGVPPPAGTEQAASGPAFGGLRPWERFTHGPLNRRTPFFLHVQGGRTTSCKTAVPAAQGPRMVPGRGRRAAGVGAAPGGESQGVARGQPRRAPAAVEQPGSGLRRLSVEPPPPVPQLPPPLP